MSNIKVFNLLHPGLQKLIMEKGWKSGLSEIQKEAIPKIMKGGDYIIEAPTAGGKTEAVLFPVLTTASKNKKNSIQILYLAPLKALLNDIDKRADEYSKTCGLHCFKWHGDVGQKEKIDELKSPSQLLLTTPESLEAILLRKAGWNNFFSGLECIIIDEAHNFASGDRGSHLISLLERLESCLKQKPQRIAITATIGNPETMLEWLAGSKRKKGERIFVKNNKNKQKDFKVLYFKDENNKNAEASLLKLKYLYGSLQQKKTIIFSGSRTYSETIASVINKLNKLHLRRIPIKVRTHHSAVSKYYREEAERRIKSKNDLESGIDAIISTSTLELGIDIGLLDQVIQLGPISSSSSFLQRVGRTGRRDYKPQFFRGLNIKEDNLLLMTSVVSLGLRGISEKISFPKKAYHILAHQLICLILQNFGINQEKAWRIFSPIHCFSNISKVQYFELVKFMIDEKYLINLEGELTIGENGEKKFLGSNWRKLFAVFESGPIYDVFNERKHVGTLDSAFVDSIELPFHFVLGGVEWEAYKINVKLRQVIAKKTTSGDAPKWVSYHGMDVPIETAKEAGKLIFGESLPSFLNNNAKNKFFSLQYKMKSLNWNKKKWVLEDHSNEVELWTFCGDRINRTLAKIITENNIGKAASSFKKITIKKDKEKTKDIVENVLDLILKIKSDNSEKKPINYYTQLKNSLKLMQFSKFTKCLPKNLWIEAQAERVFDYNGLLRELDYIKIEVINKMKII